MKQYFCFVQQFNSNGCIYSIFLAYPYNLVGTVSVDGNMTNFVSDNLVYEIKLSGPAKKDSIGNISKDSTPSGVSKHFNNITNPTRDLDVVNAIEVEAHYLAASVDNLTENLCNLLHSVYIYNRILYL